MIVRYDNHAVKSYKESMELMKKWYYYGVPQGFDNI